MAPKATVSISIVLPVYNAAEFLPACLEALLEQTVPALEIIAVDDGSTDASAIILETYASQFPSIKIITQTNQGSWQARLAGISAASGSHIGFCDSDDVVLPQLVETASNKAQSSDADVVVWAYKRINANTNKILATEMTKFGLSVLSATNNPGFLPVINTGLVNKLFKAELLKKLIVFDHPPRRYMEDAFLFFSVLPDCQTFAFISTPLYHYLVRSGSNMSGLTSTSTKQLSDYLSKIRGHYTSLAVDNDLLEALDLMAFIHLGVSMTNLLSQTTGEQIGDYVKTIRQVLNSRFPLWRHNKFATLRYNRTHNWHNLMPMLALWCFKLHVFTPLMSLYQFVSQKLQTGAKW